MAFNKSIVGRENGQTTATSTTDVVVANVGITASSIVIFQDTAGAPIALGPKVLSLDPGVGFTYDSESGDTNTYRYLILGG
jgi:hypothetical protein